MKDKTVIYYSSNREKPEYEERIARDLLTKIGDLPLISVTQKPMPYLGDNIVVGDVGLSYWNIYKQMQIAIEKSKTRWIITAEADCLYPPTGYFDFNPPDLPLLTDDMKDGFGYNPKYAYHFRNLYILYKNVPDFHEKHFSLCGLVADADYLLSRIYRSTKKRITWVDGYSKPRPLFNKFNGWSDFTGDISIINMKTLVGGLKNWTGVTENHKAELPFWGSAKEMKELWL
jgi:hypothetical protein